MIFIEKTDEGKAKNIFFGNLNLDKDIESYVTIPNNISVDKTTNINKLQAVDFNECYEINEQTDESAVFLLEEL